MSSATTMRPARQREGKPASNDPSPGAPFSDESMTAVLETLAPTPNAPEFASTERLKATHNGFGAPY